MCERVDIPLNKLVFQLTSKWYQAENFQTTKKNSHVITEQYLCDVYLEALNDRYFQIYHLQFIHEPDSCLVFRMSEKCCKMGVPKYIIFSAFSIDKILIESRLELQCFQPIVLFGQNRANNGWRTFQFLLFGCTLRKVCQKILKFGYLTHEFNKITVFFQLNEFH